MATAQQLADKNTQNVGLVSLRVAFQYGFTKYGMIDAVGDVFEDQSGIDTANIEFADYDVLEYYESPLAPVDGGQTFYDLVENHSPTAGSNCQTKIPTGVGGDTDPFGGVEPVFLLNDTADRVIVPDSATFQINGDATGEVFVKFDALSTFQVMMAQWNTDTSFYLGTNGDDNILFGWGDSGAGVGGTATSTSSPLSVDTWHHVSFVKSGTNVKVVVDGTAEINTTVDSDWGNSAEPICIGANSGGNDELVGEIYAPRFWNGTAIDYTVTAQPTSPPVPSTETFYIGHTANMLLPSNSTTADAEPSNARVVVLYDPLDTPDPTLDTDYIIEVSRDNGTTWSAASLEYDSDYDNTIQILTCPPIDLTSQPSGTSMKFRVRTVAAGTRTHALYLQWD